MIINLSRSGRSGNQLLLFVHLLAVSLETGQPLITIFGKAVFELTGHVRVKTPNGSKWCIAFPINPHGLVFWFLFGIATRFRRWVFPHTVQNGQHIRECSHLKTLGRIHLVSNWYSRDHMLVEKHAEKIREYLRFSNRHVIASQAVVETIRKDNPTTLLVGVHLRRTDYRQWNNGRFAYSDSQYKRFLRSFSDAYNGTRSVHFVLVSDEKISTDSVVPSGLSATFFSRSTFEDMAMLSKCDFVIGPPSTFSQLAAFLGGRKYHAVFNADDPCFPSSFVRLSTVRDVGEME